MSARSNSLRSVFVDSIYLVGVMGLTAAAMTALARGAEPNATPSATQSGETSTNDQPAVEHIDGQSNSDDKEPSGSQVESLADKRQANMLGMDLHQHDEGDIRVSDITATSPAWDAGIRNGDRILSIDGLEPHALTPWVEDLAKVLHETPDGHSIAVEVERDGEKLDLRVRLPISRAAAVRDARQEERAIAQMAAGQNAMPNQIGQSGVQGVPGATQTAGYDRGYGGWGVDAGFFGGDGSGNTNDDRLATNAVAELIGMNSINGGANANNNINNQQNLNQQNPNQQNLNGIATGQNSGGAAGTAGQVGIAVFHDNGQSVNAMVSVRNLPQGNYLVGISQSDVLNTFGAGANGGVGNGAINNTQGITDPRTQNSTRQLNRRQMRNQQMRNQQGNRQVPPNQAAPTQPGQGTRVAPFGRNNGNTPAPAGGAAPSGAAKPAGGASLANPNFPATLAQQIDPNQGSGIGQQNVNPSQNTGQNQAARGQAVTDRAGTNTSPNSLDDNRGAEVPNDFNADPNQDGAGMPPMLAQIGMLKVGPDGSGRVQNQLDGVTVENLAGLTVIVVEDRQQRGFAPNPNDANPQRNNATNNPNAAQNGARVAGNPQNGIGNANVNQGNQTVGPSIVARGDIQLINGGVGLPGLGSGQNDPNMPDQQGQQADSPANNAPPIEQNQIPISDPSEGF